MRLIQISVTSVWLLRAVEMDFARGKIRNRWLMMGILLGVVLWIPGNERGRFSGITGRTVIAGTYLLDPVSNAGPGSR